MNYICDVKYNSEEDLTIISVRYKDIVVKDTLKGNKLSHCSEHLIQYKKKDMIKQLEELVWT